MTEDAISRFLSQRAGALRRSVRIRPMGTNELLDASIGVYQSIGRTLLLATFVPALVVALVWTIVSQRVFPMLFSTSSPGDMGVEVAEAAMAVGLIFMVGLPALLFVLSYASAVVTQLVSSLYLGQISGIAEAHLRALKLLPRLLRLGLVEATMVFGVVGVGILFLLWSSAMDEGSGALGAVLVAVLGFVLLYASVLVVPFVICRLILVPVVATLEPETRGVLKRATDLMKAPQVATFGVSGYGVAWKCFFIVVVLFGIMAGGAAAVVDLLGVADALETLGGPLLLKTLAAMGVAGAPAFLAIWVVVPVWCTTATLLYYDRRIRHEAFDIEFLSKDVRRADRSARFQL